MVKTSIIIPVYNTANYLRECFESIFRQTQKEIEIIAINDGSTDDSFGVLQKIKKEHPEIKIFSQENEGLGNTRNRGIELATGEFIYFMDSDDCLVDNALECCYQYAKENQLDVVMFDAETFGDIRYNAGCYDRRKIVTEQEKVLSGKYYAEKYWPKSFIPSACLIYTSTQFIKKHGLKFLPQIYYEDNEFHIKLLPLARRVMYIPQTLYKRRYRKESITTVEFDIRHARDLLTMVQNIKVEDYNGKLYSVVQRLRFNFLKSLYRKCIARNLLKDVCFVQGLYHTILEVCGGSIVTINRFSAIDLLHEIIKTAPQNVFSQIIKENVKKRRKEIAEDIFMEIPLQSTDKYVGIYGTGENTKRFLRIYKEIISDIRAKLIFIDSSESSIEKKFGGYSIFNIDSIGKIPLECIVIASVKYEVEMYNTVKEKYGDRFKIIRLGTDLKF